MLTSKTQIYLSKNAPKILKYEKNKKPDLDIWHL